MTDTNPAVRRGCGCALALFFLLPLALLTGAAVWAFRSNDAVNNWSTARGQVVDTVWDEELEASFPEVRFTSADGQTWQFTHGIGGNAVTGDELVVLYDPSDPRQVVVSSFTSLWLGPALLAGGWFAMLLVWMGLRRVRTKVLAAGGTVVSPPVPPLPPPRAARPPPVPEHATGDATADDDTPVLEFRRVESGFDDVGGLRYRAVAFDAGRNIYYSDWLPDDPTERLMQTGYRIGVARRGDGWVVTL